MLKNLRIYLGLIFWIIALIFLNSRVQQIYQNLAPQQKLALGELKNYYLHSPEAIEIFFEHWVWIRAGDQVLTRDANGELLLIGRVLSMGPSETGYVCTIKLFEPNYQEKLTQNTDFYYVQTKTNAVWILNTLLPTEKKQIVLEIVDRFLAQNRGYISEILLPLVKDLGKETYLAIEEDFPEVWKLHQSRLDVLFEKHKVTTLENELIPMIKNHLWPLIQKEATPTLESIGKELWQEFPKWGIAWRSFYEKIPGTDTDHVQKHWQKYLNEAAIPLLEKRTPDLLKVVKNIVMKSSREEKISSSLKRSLGEVLADTEFILVLKDILRDLILNNSSLKNRLKKRLEDAEFQKQLSFLSSRFEPYVSEIFNLILLDEEKEGISPNLARVLRTQILHKDTRFIYVEFKEGGARPSSHFKFLGVERKDPFGENQD